MAVQDWSTNPDLNVTIDGINIAEGWPAANANNAVRALMANVRVMYNAIPTASSFVTTTGGVFTGNPTFQGRGGYLHNNDPANTSCRIFYQAIGGAPPGGIANGDWLVEW